MARQIKLKCDVCKRPCEQVVAKLNYVPVINGISTAVHSNYSYHADVGECCGERILKLFNFQKRVSAEEYQQRRRRAAAR